MKKITLPHGKYTLVDDTDFGYFNQFKWHLNHGYVTRTVYIGGGKKNPKYQTLRLHREILKVIKGYEVDHIDHNRLNNQKSNLRIVTHQQNMVNTSLRRTNTSGIKGVSWNTAERKWIAQIQDNKKKIRIGAYIDKQEAILARKQAEIIHWGSAQGVFYA